MYVLQSNAWCTLQKFGNDSTINVLWWTTSTRQWPSYFLNMNMGVASVSLETLNRTLYNIIQVVTLLAFIQKCPLCIPAMTPATVTQAFLHPARHISLVSQIRQTLFPPTSFPIIMHYQTAKSQLSMVSTLTRTWDDAGFDVWQTQGIFFFLKMSRVALGPTPPPLQWEGGLFLWKGNVKKGCGLDMKLTTHLHPVPRLRMHTVILLSPCTLSTSECRQLYFHWSIIWHFVICTFYKIHFSLFYGVLMMMYNI